MAQLANPSTYDLRFTNHQYNCTTDNQFCTDIQIKAATGAGNFVAGSHTIWFFYNKSALTTPTYTPSNFHTGTTCPIGSASYNPYGSLSFGYSQSGPLGEANVTTLLQTFIPGFECPVVGQDWVTMGEVCFTILDPNLPTDLEFGPTYTSINLSSDTPAHNQGTFTPFHQSAQINAGTVSVDKAYVCRNETIASNVADAISGGDSKFVGLAVSNSGTISDFAQFQAATKYRLDSTTTATYTNGGSFPTNTPLYAYSFIGQHPAYSIDQTCFDLSAPSAPFVMLKDIQVTASDYVCIGGGQARINLLVTGGMPNYQPTTEQFSVDVAGADYAGAAMLDDNTTIELTVNDGAMWEVQFTDSQGCAGSLSGTFVAASECTACAADAGTPTLSDNLVCWNETINWNVTGSTLGAANGYVGMFINTQNNLTSVPNPANSLTVGPSATKTNDGSTIALNTPYYLYSFIGEGAPFAYNPGCTDLSVSANTFVFLAPITINTNSTFTYNCTSGSTATIALTPQGGLPAYDGAQTFTVSTTGATYSGPAQVSNNTAITVSVSGTNTPWTVTFTDSQGCTGSIGSTFTAAACAPPACGADAGTAAVNDDFICWGEQAQYSASGYSLGSTPPADRYVGLAVSASNNVDSINNDFQFVQLYNTPTANYTHNVSPFTFNTPLYLYSYIGTGTVAGSINTACTDVSAPAGPFVFLMPIATDTGAYICNLATNTASISVVAAGGKPAYNASEQFTVTATGATGAPAQVGNNSPFTITVNNGATWSVTFTDTEGCTATIGDTFTIGSVDCPGCTADAGTPTLSDNYICWNSTIDLNVSGYTLGAPDGYIGLALSPSGTISNLSEFSAATKYTLDAAATATKTNNGLTFPTNTPIYLYSFVGKGTPFSINNACHDISAPVGPFVALQNMAINGGGGVNYTCSGGSTATTTLTVTGGLPGYNTSDTYTFSGSAGVVYGGGAISPNTPITITVPTGSWSVTVTDAQGCTAAITDNFDPATDCGSTCAVAPTSNAGGDQTVCAATATLAASTPAVGTGTWSVAVGTATFANAVSPTSGISGLSVGTNRLVWSVSAPNCPTARDTVNITRLAAPAANAGADQNINVNNTALAATAASPTGATGTWSVIGGTGTFADANSPTTTVSGLSNGANTFRWTVSLAGCTAVSDDVLVTVSSLPPVCLPVSIIKTSSADYCGSGNGAICMTLSGGEAPYNVLVGNQTFAITANSQEQCLQNLSAGSYDILITDANGCTTTAFEAIAIADVFIEYGVSVADATCNTSNGAANSDGSICLEFEGGMAPYSVTRNGVAFATVSAANTEVCISNLAAGAYNLVVTDANGCARGLDLITIQTPATCGNDFSVTKTTNAATCQTNGAVCLTISGGNAPYTVQEGTAVLGTLSEGVSQCLPLSAGTHTLLITGADGFSSNTTATILAPFGGCNHLPNIHNDNVAMEAGDSLPFCFNPLNNDTDSDGDAITISQTTQPANGAVSIVGNQLCYMPNAGFSGIEAFSYTACDNDGCNTANVLLTVVQAPLEPCDNPNSLCVGLYPATIDFCLDFCELNDSAVITEYYTTYNCGVTILEDNCINYQPLPGLVGNDQIFVTACYGEGNCQTIAINMEVSATCAAAEEPPIANNDSANTSEGEPVMINALANDQETNGDAFAISTFTQPAHGTVVQVGNQFLYTPNDGFDGLDSFSYTICDNDGCDQAFVSITVANVNCDNPTDLCVGFFPNNIDFCLDFCDLSGTHTITEFNTTFHCSLDPLPNDCFTYTPLPGFFGNDLISITACETANPSNCQTIEIPVFVGNCTEPDPEVPPVANDDNASANCTPITINAFANDQATNGDAFTAISVLTQPLHGALVQNANSFTYTATAGYVGNDSFTYSLCDNDGCDQATVTISVNCPDDEECVNPDNLCVGLFPNNIDFCLDFCELNGAFYIDAYNTTFNCSIDTINSPCFTYTPLPGFGMGAGQNDLISITACEVANPANCQTIQVNMFVGDCSQDTPPTANNDTATSACTSVTVSPLANDQATDGDAFAIDEFTQPANGTVTQNGNNFIYTPAAGFNGIDAFTYTICDNDGCATATVSINVQCEIECDNPDDLCVGIFPSDIDFCLDFCNLNGAIFIDTYSTTFNCSIDTINSPCFTYTPLPGFGMGAGQNDLISITACEVANPTNCQTLNIPIFVGDCDGPQTPPTANNDNYNVDDCAPATLDVTANDQQTEGDPYSITAFTQPAHGTVAQSGNSLIYTPEPGFTGTVTFTYTITDNDGASTATVTLTSNCPAQLPPDTNDDTLTITACETVTISPLSNDIATNGDEFHIESFTQPAHGVLISSSDSFTYIPDSDFNGTVTFTYEACDNDGCSTGTVTIVISGCTPEEPPIAIDDPMIAISGCNTSTIEVTNNDQSTNGDSFTITSVSTPAHGSVAQNGTTISYTPQAGFNGADSFTYTICDNDGCATATVTVVVTNCELEVEPDGIPDTAQTDCNPVTIDVLANDQATNGDPMDLGIVGLAQNGIVQISGSQVIYTPLPEFMGTDQFIYNVCDNDGCDEVTVTITVAGCPDNDPVANPDEYVVACVSFLTVLENDEFDATSLYIGEYTQPQHGFVGWNFDQFLYVADDGYVGPDSFTYQICDDNGCSTTVTVSLTVGCEDTTTPPTATDDVAVSACDGVSIDVLANDIANGGTLQLSANTQPLHGTVSAIGNIYIYTPEEGYVGTDSFTYTVCDDDACSTATVTLTVNCPTTEPQLPPDATDDNATSECVAITLNALSNDIVTNGDIITIGEYTQPFNGSVVLNDNSTFTYTPNGTFTGFDMFDYTACDNDGCTTATVTIAVICDPDVPPVAVDDLATATCDGVTINVLSNDQATDGDSFTINAFSNPAHGSLSTTTNGFVYVPQSGYVGSDSFTYTICDNDGCDEATVTLTVNCPTVEPQLPPTANNDVYTATCSTATLTVMSNDQSTNGDVFSIDDFTQPAHGTLVQSGNNLLYTATTGYVGSDSFTYTICDNDGCDEATVTLTVNCPTVEPQLPPDANDDTTNAGCSAVTIAVTANDLQTNGDAFAIMSFTQPAHGTLVQNGNNFSYTANAGYVGSDSFTYNLCDNDGCTTATVSITVNCTSAQTPPIAVNDQATTGCSSVTISVLNNDQATDGDSFSISGNTNPAHGTVSALANGFVYTPNSGYVGNDSFTYTICDNDGCSTATVNISVNCASQNPPIAGDDSATTSCSAITINALANDQATNGDTFSIDGFTQPAHGSVAQTGNSFVYTPNSGYVGSDSFTYTICDNDGCDQATVTIIVNCADECENPDNLCLNPFPSNIQFCIEFCEVTDAVVTDFESTFLCSVEPLGGNCFQYTPLPGFFGPDTVNVTGCNAAGLCETIQVNLFVGACTEENPPIANDDVANTTEGNPINIDVTVNDQETDGDDFAIDGFTQPANGTVVLNPDGTFTYTPNTGFTGTDVFTYTICDNDGCDEATVTIIVIGGNTPPNAQDDTETTEQGNCIVVDVLANDSDADGDEIEITAIIPPANGTVAITPLGIEYCPNPGFTGTDVFTYQICDSEGNCDEATVTITVTAPECEEEIQYICTNPLTPNVVCVEFCDLQGTEGLEIIDASTTFNCSIVLLNDSCLQYTALPGFVGQDSLVVIGCNDAGFCDTTVVYVFVGCAAPIANDDVATVQNNGNSHTINQLINDWGVCFDPIVTITNQADHGTASVNADGLIVYTPVPGYTGTDQLTYSICNPCNPTGACDEAVVTITVTGDPCPECGEDVDAQPDLVSTPFETPITIDVLTNDFGVGISITETTNPSNGTITVNANGTITYTPNDGFSGIDYFTYTICNADGECDVTLVAVTVLPEDAENQPPVANNDVASTPVNTPVTINVLANDTDTNGDILTATILNEPENGTVVVNPDGTMTYTPDPGFVGTDCFTYLACDNGTPSLCDAATVCVTVGDDDTENHSPIADDDSETTGCDPVIVDILSGDFDPDGDETTYIIGTNPANGNVLANPDGTVTYTPNDGFEGPDYFTYILCDNATPSLCDTAYVQVSVLGCDGIVANDDEAHTSVNEPVTIDVTANDLPAGSTINDIVDDPENGTAIILDNEIVYSPNPGFVGVDTLVYQICDTDGNCDIATVIIYIDEPVDAQPDIAFTDEGQPTTINVLTNDIGCDLDVLSITQPSNGAAVLNSDNTVNYTPNPGFSGTDYFTYVVEDCNGNTDQTTVSVVVLPEGTPNLPPVANNDEATTPIDTPVTIPVLDNDTDPNGDPITVTTILPPTDGSGTVTIDPSGTVTFTPNPGFEGCTSFGYVVCDNGSPALCDTAYVQVAVGDSDACLNNPPQAVDDAATTEEGTPVTIDVLENDDDPDGDDLIVTTVLDPMNGSVDIIGNEVLYTPNPGFTGVDTFMYIVCDNGTPVALCDTAIVVVTVTEDEPNDEVNAEPDIAFTAPNTPVVINILANDLGENLDVTTIADQPDFGTVAINPDNTVTYTPNPGFIGTDYFEYVVCNTVSGECDMTIVAVVVLPPDSTNLPPNAVNDMGTTEPSETICVDVLANDNDPFGGDAINITNFTQPANGIVTQEGSFLCYTPNDGFVGEDVFTYTICDNGTPSLCDEATVVIGVGTDEIPNNMPIAVDDADTTEMATPVTIDVLNNDSDPDGDALSIVLITDPGHGTAVLVGTNIVYTPEDGFTGIDYFTYVICDNGSPALCDTAYVSILVTPTGLNAQPDIAFTNVNVPVQINVLANDEGGTGDLTVTAIVTPPTNGSVTNNASSVTYAPNEDFVGTDYFEYIVCDEAGNCDTTLVTVIVLPDSLSNLPPNAVNDVAVTPVDTEVCIDVLDNDNDPLGGNDITITAITQPANGASMQLNDSTLCYLPNPGYVGLDSFTYVICDNATPSLCDTAVVVINVGSDEPSNNPPLAVDDDATTEAATPVTIDILANDSDPDGDDISITLVTDPANGTVSIDPITGIATYTPNEGFEGTDFFTYVICDNGTPSLCDTAYVTIIVGEDGDPQPPVAVDDNATTEVNTEVVIDVLDNDFDPDGEEVSIVQISEQPAHGIAVISIINPDSIVIIYTPDPDYIGLDTFCYIITDPTGLTDTACVYINITEASINEEVIAVDETDTTQINTPIILPVLDNDTYVIDGATGLEITILDAPSNGTAVVNPDSTITYTPNPEFAGTDSFTYVLCVFTPTDTLCDTALVVVVVQGDPNCELIFATGFSPNDDAINDLYLIEGASAEELAVCFPDAQPELIIFNRWGDVVYRVANYDNSKAWNGKFKGTSENSPDATYFYILTIDPNDKDANYQGCLELKR